MEKFGLEEIRVLRDQWADMPAEEYAAERKKLLCSAKRRMNRIRKQGNGKSALPELKRRLSLENTTTEMLLHSSALEEIHAIRSAMQKEKRRLAVL